MTHLLEHQLNVYLGYGWTYMNTLLRGCTWATLAYSDTSILVLTAITPLRGRIYVKVRPRKAPCGLPNHSSTLGPQRYANGGGILMLIDKTPSDSIKFIAPKHQIGSEMELVGDVGGTQNVISIVPGESQPPPPFHIHLNHTKRSRIYSLVWLQ